MVVLSFYLTIYWVKDMLVMSESKVVTPHNEEYQPLRDPGVLNRNFELPLLNMEGVHCLLEEELA